MLSSCSLKIPLRAFSINILILFLASFVFAWNKPGHMVTGALAADRLKTIDPQALARVVHILQSHPAFDDWQQVVEERAGLDDEAVVLFAMAARWPDDARGTNFAH